jgi:hypothetical protein
MVAAVGAGYIADKHRRDFVSKLAGVVGFFAIAVTLVGLMIPDSMIDGGGDKIRATADHIRYLLITVALGMWGVYVPPPLPPPTPPFSPIPADKRRRGQSS